MKCDSLTTRKFVPSINLISFLPKRWKSHGNGNNKESLAVTPSSDEPCSRRNTHVDSSDTTPPTTANASSNQRHSKHGRERRGRGAGHSNQHLNNSVPDALPNGVAAQMQPQYAAQLSQQQLIQNGQFVSMVLRHNNFYVLSARKRFDFLIPRVRPCQQ